MGAGRELDALVAERVMGWTGIHCMMGGGPYGPMEGFTPHGDPTGHGIANKSVPAYSTSISAAWEVVERFKTERADHGHSETLFEVVKVMDHWAARYYWVSYNSDMFLAAGVPRESTEEFARASGETAPLAICRAALLTTLEDQT
jgi:hypothetical protein